MSIGALIRSDRPVIMGILNVTPDSFYDGGEYFEGKAAVEHALRMFEEGADVIDVGGESTRPGSEGVSAEEEMDRVIPVIEEIRRRSDVSISIDTRKSLVASAAIAAGANMINDISAGLYDPGMLDVAAQFGVPICLMHMRGTPKNMQDNVHYDDLLGEIRSFLDDAVGRARSAGVYNIIVDPGIGFAKSAEDNLKILKNLEQIRLRGIPILVGTSRKSFIGKLLGHDLNQRLEATLASLYLAYRGGARWFRVHDVASVRRFMDAVHLFENETCHVTD